MCKSPSKPFRSIYCSHESWHEALLLALLIFGKIKVETIKILGKQVSENVKKFLETKQFSIVEIDLKF